MKLRQINKREGDRVRRVRKGEYRLYHFNAKAIVPVVWPAEPGLYNKVISAGSVVKIVNSNKQVLESWTIPEFKTRICNYLDCDDIYPEDIALDYQCNNKRIPGIPGAIIETIDVYVPRKPV